MILSRSRDFNEKCCKECRDSRKDCHIPGDLPFECEELFHVGLDLAHIACEESDMLFDFADFAVEVDHVSAHCFWRSDLNISYFLHPLSLNGIPSRLRTNINEPCARARERRRSADHVSCSPPRVFPRYCRDRLRRRNPVLSPVDRRWRQFNCERSQSCRRRKQNARTCSAGCHCSAGRRGCNLVTLRRHKLRRYEGTVTYLDS